MNVMEAIQSRRSVRAYTARKVDDDTIRALLRAAVQAPNAMNAQPWLFAVVQDVARLKHYSDDAKRMLLAAGNEKTRRYDAMLGDPGYNIFYDASTLIVIGVLARDHYGDADCWLAAENLMLAATDMGLGTCCMGFSLPALNTREALEELGFGKDGAAIAPLVLGYPSAILTPVFRAEPKIVSWAR